MPDDSPAPDPVAAWLAEARARFSNTNYAIATESPRMLSVAMASTSDVPRLLAAVEAALRFHAPEEAADGTWFCVFCSCAEGDEVEVPCLEVQAISAALLGKEDHDGV